MKTIDIKGKKYVTVNERLIYFRENFDGYRLVSEIYELTEDRVVMCASIINPEGSIVATGHAYEDKDSTFINKTSFIENAETSAWGRALANYGIGVQESVASADEVVTAIAQKDDKPWMSHEDFTAIVGELNLIPRDEIRQTRYDEYDKKYRMKKDYRSQLLEIVNQRDINV